MAIETDCNKCKVSKHCEFNGNVPIIYHGMDYKCSIIGGYGKVKVDEEILSEDLKEKSKVHGPCLTIVNMPYIDENVNGVFFKIIKIMHEPILHDREKNVIVY